MTFEQCHFLTIILDHAGCSLTGNMKQKKMSHFLSERWSRSLKKFEQWSLTRELLKQYLTEKQNGYLESGCFRDVVAYERVDRNTKCSTRQAVCLYTPQEKPQKVKSRKTRRTAIMTIYRPLRMWFLQRRKLSSSLTQPSLRNCMQSSG